MSFESTDDLADIAAPYGKEIKVQEVTFEGGMQLLRIRIREGKRFTTLDLDPDTTSKLVEVLSQWQQE